MDPSLRGDEFPTSTICEMAQAFASASLPLASSIFLTLKPPHALKGTSLPFYRVIILQLYGRQSLFSFWESKLSRKQCRHSVIKERSPPHRLFPLMMYWTNISITTHIV